MRIESTLSLAEMGVSEALWAEAKSRPALGAISEAVDMEFDAGGNLADPLFRGRIVPTANAQMPVIAPIPKQKVQTEVRVMLSWVVTFLVVALIAGILGFGGVAGVSIEIAKTIFFIAVVLFLISAVIGLARGRTRV